MFTSEEVAHGAGFKAFQGQADDPGGRANATERRREKPTNEPAQGSSGKGPECQPGRSEVWSLCNTVLPGSGRIELCQGKREMSLRDKSTSQHRENGGPRAGSRARELISSWPGV